MGRAMLASGTGPADPAGAVTLFLCGDVMMGRGIDQVLPQPLDPTLHESYLRSALGYVALAERAHGPIPRPAAPGYVWGDALAEFARVRPAARIVNLETAVTTSDDAWPGKGIHYRMHPHNLACLTAAGVDCCVLANNHVLDFGYGGLAETLATLHAARIATAGAGADQAAAESPAIIALPGGRRLLVFAYGLASSGVPPDWAATRTGAGVAWLAGLAAHDADGVARQVAAQRRDGDLVVASLHWGGNWDYTIGAAERRFAQRLIEEAGVDLVHGHSSHHVKGIEVHRGKLIIYGCGDFLNDYEGIGGYEAFRGDLSLMYFPTLAAGSGRLLALALTATQLRRFQVRLADPAGADALEAVLDREGRALGTRVERTAPARFLLRWRAAGR